MCIILKRISSRTLLFFLAESIYFGRGAFSRFSLRRAIPRYCSVWKGNLIVQESRGNFPKAFPVLYFISPEFTTIFAKSMPTPCVWVILHDYEMTSAYATEEERIKLASVAFAIRDFSSKVFEARKQKSTCVNNEINIFLSHSVQ